MDGVHQATGQEMGQVRVSGKKILEVRQIHREAGEINLPNGSSVKLHSMWKGYIHAVMLWDQSMKCRNLWKRENPPNSAKKGSLVWRSNEKGFVFERPPKTFFF